MTDEDPASPPDAEEELAKQFRRVVLAGFEALSLLGYGERDGIERYGAIEVAHRALSQPRVTDGFSRLWEMGRLEMSIEAIVLRKEFAHLFTEKERRIAYERLQAHGYSPERT